MLRNTFWRLAAVLLISPIFAACLDAAPPYDGYANSPYTTGTAASDYIQSIVIQRGSTVLLQNLNTGPGASPYNTYYGAISPALLIPGQQHSLDVTVCPAYGQGTTAWIDYNNDGDFLDTGEEIGYTAVIAASQTGTINFTPAAGASGTRRLRIRCSYAQAGPHSPTTSYTYGEAEDYLVNLGFTITTSSPLPSAVINVAYSTTITATNGTTPYVWNTSIAGLPAGITGAQVGDDLVLSGTPTQLGTFNFNLSVTDNTAQNATAPFQLSVLSPPGALPFADDFSTNTGWQFSAPWSRGSATAFSQASPACSEPGSDHSPSADNMILGDTIGGTYAANDSNTHWAVSPAVDCSGASVVRLRFWRWLGLAIGSTAKIEVSNNGTNWTNIWTSTSGVTYGGTTTPVWTSDSWDITTWAAGYGFVQVRFGIGPTGATASTGWCIDDVVIEEPTADMEVRETGSAGPIITDDEAVGGGRDFGVIAIGTQSAPLTIYITNNGPTPITFGTITKTGAQPNDFYVNAAGLANPLNQGSSTSFTITFYRTTVGISTATIELAHTAAYSGVSPFQINVRGEAVAPQPIIQVNEGSATGPQIAHQQSPTGTPRDFGSQDVSAGPTAAITIVVTNAGTGTLTIATPDMGGTWWTEYYINSVGLTSQIAPGQSTSFTVAFDPSSVGVKDAYVRIPHTDGTQPSPFYVPVVGTGTSGGAPVMGLEWGATAIADGGSLNIGAVPVSTTVNLTFTIRNTGTANLNLTGTPLVQVSNEVSCTAVVATGPGTAVLAAGTTTTFVMDVTATAAGNWSYQISIPNTDPTRNPYDATVMGSATGTMELRVLTQPANAAKGEPFTMLPVVAVTDAIGTVDTTDNSTFVQVTITAGTGASGAFLGGTVTKQVVNGMVEFDDLEIDKAGVGYTLTFSDFLGPLGSVESDPFDITGGGGGDGGGDEEEESCSTGASIGRAPAVAMLFAILAVAARLRRRKERA